jgi:small subunit ribosomal protein S6
MNKYEGMFIIKPELTEDERKAFVGQITDAIGKNGGKVTSAEVWSERRKLTFPIKKKDEGIYYLVRFEMPIEGLDKIRYVFKLNENILRVQILREGE